MSEEVRLDLLEDSYFTYEAILKRMMDRIEEPHDKREGSIIFDLLAPTALAIAQGHEEIKITYENTFADTAHTGYLENRTREIGVKRKEAVKAVRLGKFYKGSDLMDIPIGSRFSIEEINYTAITKISTGNYELECEEVGDIGNIYEGNLIPIDPIKHLSKAILVDRLILGIEAEEDESLRKRFYKKANEPAFGGNIADYEQTIMAIEGVGGVKVFPVWTGPKNVKCVIVDTDLKTATQGLIDKVQEMVDPLTHTGEGEGTAPIWHFVTIGSTTDVPIHVEMKIVFDSAYQLSDFQEPIEEAIETYLNTLVFRDTIVRITQIEYRILNIKGIIDISETKINGVASNYTLRSDAQLYQSPVKGVITIGV